MDSTLSEWEKSLKELRESYKNFLIAFENVQESNAKVADAMGRMSILVHQLRTEEEKALDEEATALSKLAEAEGVKCARCEGTGGNNAECKLCSGTGDSRN
jgi:hypothetical protein